MEETQLIQVKNRIYELRGQKVMLDSDLAMMYGIETKQLKRAVRRNIERFEGEDFMFELTKEECLRCQIGTLNGKRGEHLKYMPFAFTELGVAMLSSVLNSPTAIQVNRGIMRAFVELRKMVSLPPADKLSILQKEVASLKEYIEEVFEDYNDINEDTRMQLELINEAIAELQADKARSSKPRPKIGFIADDDIK